MRPEHMGGDKPCISCHGVDEHAPLPDAMADRENCWVCHNGAEFTYLFESASPGASPEASPGARPRPRRPRMTRAPGRGGSLIHPELPAIGHAQSRAPSAGTAPSCRRAAASGRLRALGLGRCALRLLGLLRLLVHRVSLRSATGPASPVAILAVRGSCATRAKGTPRSRLRPRPGYAVGRPREQGQVLVDDVRRRQGRQLGMVVGGRYLNHVRAGQVQAVHARRMNCSSRVVRPPGSGVPVPGAWAGSRTSMSTLT